MIKTKILLLLAIVLVLGLNTFIKADPNDPVEAMKRFRNKQQGLQKTLANWKDSFAQNCPYYPRPPAKASVDPIKPKDVNPVLPSDPNKCAADQTADADGKCTCKDPSYILNALGNCVPPKTPIEDPCSGLNKCEVCQKKNGQELCKKCENGHMSCQLCLNKNDQQVKCIDCDGRTCCAAKLSDPNSKVCSIFPKEDEPSKISPEPSQNNVVPVIVDKKDPTKICYELDMTVRDAKPDAAQQLTSYHGKAIVCKACLKDRTCEVNICGGKACENCSTPECLRPF